MLPKRLARFSLELAEEKTKLLRFGRFAAQETARLGEGAPSTFDFLGFTHYCGRSRAGKFKLKWKTAKKKFRAKVRELKGWLRTSLTTPAKEVWKTLNTKLQGHYQYYGVNDNWPSLMAFREVAIRMTIRWLRRRSQKTFVSWQDFKRRLTHHPIASPRKLKNLIALSCPP